MHRTASNKTTLVSGIPNIINDENVIVSPRQGKKLISILSNEFCKEQPFPYLLSKGKFSYSSPPDIPVSPSPARYSNQRFLNVNLYFALDAACIVFARSVYEQHLLRSLRNFAMHKI